MAFDELKYQVWIANTKIVDAGLVTLTWGNAGGVDRDAGVLVIKPSGVAFDELTPDHMVVLSLETGAIVEGNLKPSSDTPTYLHLARHFKTVGGIVHTHSTHATAFCQARRDLPALGTTHADHFYGTIPVVRPLTPAEIAEAYEHNTGVAIVDTFRDRRVNPEHISAALVPGHGPFAWGASPIQAFENALVLEECARMALATFQLNPTPDFPKELLDKHYLRKHGVNAYYGQSKP